MAKNEQGKGGAQTIVRAAGMSVHSGNVGALESWIQEVEASEGALLLQLIVGAGEVVGIFRRAER